MTERNLVFETMGQPRGGYGAVIVYTEPVFRGRTVYLLKEVEDWKERMGREGVWRDDDPYTWTKMVAANVVPRTVNGEEGFSAWFPRVPAGYYLVHTAVHLRLSDVQKLTPNIFYAWVTAFPGEVAEVDLRAG